MDSLESFLPVTPGFFFSLSPLINYDDKTTLEHPQNKDKQCVLSEAGAVRGVEDALPSLSHICFPLQTVKGKKKGGPVNEWSGVTQH